jgi:integrase/recombinase XerD
MNKVTVYIRHSGSRKYEKAHPKKLPTLQGQLLPGAIFVLRFTDTNGKRQYVNLDCRTWDEANVAACFKQIELAKIKRGDLKAPAPKPTPTPKVVEQVPPTKPGELMLDTALDRYLANIAIRSGKTQTAYNYNMQQFFVSCGNKPLAQISRQDLIDYEGRMRLEGLAARTIHNRIAETITMLRHFGFKEVKHTVKYVEKKVRAYRPDELKQLFSAADPEEWLLFQFFLCTGAREQEVMNAEYNDLDFVDGLFTVRAKADWKPKDYEEREIPLPDFLLTALKERMLTTKGKLIFPTCEGKKDGHMLRKLQYLAKRAGLVGEFGLHKFRKTYATLQHRAGVDARTIQIRLGHSDLTTTLAYLEGEDARSAESKKHANDTFGCLLRCDVQDHQTR